MLSLGKLSHSQWWFGELESKGRCFRSRFGLPQGGLARPPCLAGPSCHSLPTYEPLKPRGALGGEAAPAAPGLISPTRCGAQLSVAVPDGSHLPGDRQKPPLNTTPQSNLASTSQENLGYPLSARGKPAGSVSADLSPSCKRLGKAWSSRPGDHRWGQRA